MQNNTVRVNVKAIGISAGLKQNGYWYNKIAWEDHQTNCKINHYNHHY